jgi:four helix bundle protein
VISGQWSVVSGQWSVGSGQWSVGSGQWAVGSGQWAVVSGQWSVGSEDCTQLSILIQGNEMTEIKSYMDLLVWQKGIELVEDVYRNIGDFPPDERYALGAQIRRSVVSVPSNIAEGQARQHTGEFRQFLYISLGSLAELDTQLIIATKLDYVTEDAHTRLREKITELRKMLTSLIRKLTTVH